MTKPPESRQMVFFPTDEDHLAVFARDAVNFRAKKIKGVKVTFTQLKVKAPEGVIVGISVSFWIVKEVPDELRRLLTETDFVPQADNGYRARLPDDKSLLKLIFAAEAAARRELFPDRYPTALAAE